MMIDVEKNDAKEKQPKRHKRDSLISRNITVKNHRTSMRLEPEMWSALSEVCRRERATLHHICSLVAENKPNNASLTAAMRVFIMAYFRSAATDEGHTRAGHGHGVTRTLAQNPIGQIPRTTTSLPSIAAKPQTPFRPRQVLPSANGK